MIEGIEGKIVNITESGVLIKAGSFFISAYCTPWTIQKISVGQEIKLSTFLSFPQDKAPELFAFYEQEEMELFKILIGVSKIGPKMAMKILGGANHNEIRNYIATRNVPGLSNLPGLGKKTAERLIAELGDSIEEVSGFTGTRATDNDAVDALTSLGFDRYSAEKAVRKVTKEGVSGTQAIVKKALKELQ
ncbi:MAG: Holliday junction branch migration protein RuvA [Kosmotoga sp.]|nr:MAG: Holliday junction branch migration protein RuvA [Kosmotoga sp.]